MTERHSLINSRAGSLEQALSDGSIQSGTRINANPKLSYLDGLRGLLCLIVVISHTLLMGKTNSDQSVSIFFRSWLHHWPLRLFVAGEFAVASFFVLSGCVLARRYLEHCDDRQIIISGLIRRFPRLLIPSSVALLLYYAIFHFRSLSGFILCHEMGEGSVNAEQIDFGYLLLNTFGQYFWMPALYTIQWTMQIEFAGSLIIYGLAFIVTRPIIHRYRWIIYGLLIFFLPVLWLVTNGSVPRPVQYIPPFIMGLVLSDLDTNGFLDRVYQFNRRGSIAVNCLLFLLITYFGSYPVFNTDIENGKGTLWSPLGWMFGWFWIAFGGFCLLLLCLRSQECQAFLSTKPIHILGQISFGTYLLHYIVICLVDLTFVHWIASTLGRDVAVTIGLVFFTLPITLSLAYLFYIFVDAPAVKISHWIYFLVCTRCFKMKKSIKRPVPIPLRIWLVLLLLVLVLLGISAIPGQPGHRHCDTPSTGNSTMASLAEIYQETTI